MRDQTHSLRGRLSSVSEDWRAWLPAEKARIFEDIGQQWETAYTMFSVSLDEAMTLRQTGQIGKSRQAAAVTAELSGLLCGPLISTLRALEGHARHHGLVPNAVPLNPANFRGNRCLRAARMNSLFSKVLLSQRSQFLHKVRALHEMVEDLERDFGATIQEVAECIEGDPAEVWVALDLLHYDLNTCLRETIVVFKSFLHVLPDEELAAFESEAREKARPAPARKDRPRDIRHRRPATIEGK